MYTVVPACNNADIFDFSDEVEVRHHLLADHVLGAVSACGDIAGIQCAVGALLELGVEKLACLFLDSHA